MTYNIKLNLSKLYRFHSSREPERESKSAVASRNHDYCQFRREEGKKKRASGHDPISNCPISRLRAPIRDPEKDFLNFLNEQPRSSTSMCPKHVRQQSHDAAIATINIDFSPIARRTRSHSYSFSSLALRSFIPFVFLAFTKKIMSNLAQRLIHRFAISHQSPSLLSRRPKKRTVRFVQPIKSPSAINHR